MVAATNWMAPPCCTKVPSTSAPPVVPVNARVNISVLARLTDGRVSLTSLGLPVAVTMMS